MGVEHLNVGEMEVSWGEGGVEWICSVATRCFFFKFSKKKKKKKKYAHPHEKTTRERFLLCSLKLPLF